MLVEGNYTDLPILFGANSHEGSFVYGSKETSKITLDLYSTEAYLYDTHSESAIVSRYRLRASFKILKIEEVYP